MSTRTLWKIMTILSSIGILLAIYLLYYFLNPDASQICTISTTINCEAVTIGNLAVIYGIPVSLIGLIGYITILMSSIVKNSVIALAMTAFGVLFCLRLTILEIFVEKVFCPVCGLCQLIMLAVFIISIILFTKRKKQPNEGEIAE